VKDGAGNAATKVSAPPAYTGPKVPGSEVLLASALSHSTVTDERRVGEGVPHRWTSSCALVSSGPTPLAPHVALVPLFESLAQPVALPGSMYQFGTDHDGGFVGDGPAASIFALGARQCQEFAAPVHAAEAISAGVRGSAGSVVGGRGGEACSSRIAFNGFGSTRWSDAYIVGLGAEASASGSGDGFVEQPTHDKEKSSAVLRSLTAITAAHRS